MPDSKISAKPGAIRFTTTRFRRRHSPCNRDLDVCFAARATAVCWSCWITGSPSRDTARYFSTACRITDSPPNWRMWRSFSMFEVTIEETFAAGHALRNYRGKCENVHGHNYRCQVTLEGDQLDAIGLLVDFVEMKRVVHAVLDRMDHQWLNDFPPFDVLNPSAENMVKYIHDEVKQGLSIREGVRVGAVKLWETDTASATYRER